MYFIQMKPIFIIKRERILILDYASFVRSEKKGRKEIAYPQQMKKVLLNQYILLNREKSLGNILIFFIGSKLASKINQQQQLNGSE